MAQLGKSLVFYFKYWNEMQRLCNSEDEVLEGLPEPEKTREMAKTIGRKASEQATELLEACSVSVEEHFNAIGNCGRITSRGVVERKWSLAYTVWPKRRHRPRPQPKIRAQIAIVRSEKPELIPWLWRAGDDADKALNLILRERVKVHWQDLDWIAGSVGLDRIPLLDENYGGFDVDREPLVKRVVQAFSAITNEELNALW